MGTETDEELTEVAEGDRDQASSDEWVDLLKEWDG
jgi:hypothetical protein